MGRFDSGIDAARMLGVACALGAGSLGLAYLAAAGAPTRYLVVNAGALAVGAVLVVASARAKPQPPEILVVALGTALLLTALLGVRLDGVSRWIRIGPLTLQPSLILLPCMAVLFARARSLPTLFGIVVGAAALALQPDRAMAGVLSAGMAAVALTRPDRWTLAALAAALAAFVAALIRPDALRAQPFVERVLHTAFDAGPVIGAAVWTGAILMLAPAVVSLFGGPGRREVHAAFGAVWLAVIAASLLGNYPTPIVGYGASSVLGYLLSVAAFPTPARA